MRQIEIYPIPSASNLFNSPIHGAEGVVPPSTISAFVSYFQRQKKPSREGISECNTLVLADAASIIGEDINSRFVERKIVKNDGDMGIKER